MDENEQTVDEILEDIDGDEDVVEETEKPAEQPKEAPEARKARLERELKRLNKKLGVEEPKQTAKKPEPAQKADGLDETQLDYLDLKGISDEDEIDIIERHVERTGETVRQALKDDYIIAKLEKLREGKAVKDATPSSTKRGGNQTSDLAAAIARFDATGELPENFALRSEVVNSIAERGTATKPSWS